MEIFDLNNLEIRASSLFIFQEIIKHVSTQSLLSMDGGLGGIKKTIKEEIEIIGRDSDDNRIDRIKNILPERVTDDFTFDMMYVRNEIASFGNDGNENISRFLWLVSNKNKKNDNKLPLIAIMFIIHKDKLKYTVKELRHLDVDERKLISDNDFYLKIHENIIKILSILYYDNKGLNLVKGLNVHRVALIDLTRSYNGSSYPLFDIFFVMTNNPLNDLIYIKYVPVIVKYLTMFIQLNPDNPYDAFAIFKKLLVLSKKATEVRKSIKYDSKQHSYYVPTERGQFYRYLSLADKIK